MSAPGSGTTGKEIGTSSAVISRWRGLHWRWVTLSTWRTTAWEVVRRLWISGIRLCTELIVASLLTTSCMKSFLSTALLILPAELWTSAIWSCVSASLGQMNRKRIRILSPCCRMKRTTRRSMTAYQWSHSSLNPVSPLSLYRCHLNLLTSPSPPMEVKPL